MIAGRNFWALCQDEFFPDVRAALPTFQLAIIFCQPDSGPASPTNIVFTHVSSRLFVCAHILCECVCVCACFLRTVFPCLFAQLMWMCILQCLAVGGWLESVSQRVIVFRLCLLFPISGQYANSRYQPSCLVWCLHCKTLATKHTALLTLLYPAGISRAGNPATSRLQQSGSLDRVRSDKIPLRWIFSCNWGQTEQRIWTRSE